MAANPDAAKLLDVSFAQPREGSCLSLELLAELAQLIRIKLPAAASPSGGACVSNDPNNIATLDPQNCILVPGAKLYTEEQTWDVASGTDLDFEDFKDQGIDATTCFFACYILVDSAEAGKPVLRSPGPGAENIRPNFEIKTFTASKITITVKNAASDVTVRVQLLQLPVPPVQA